ncbi:MAG: hypothetical protein AMXMBFR33_01770 [Candidatus Xenobia bacterium]
MLSANTTIAWSEKTWNPVTGCTEVSPGCDNCYARTLAERFRGQKAFPNGFDVTLHPERLDDPLRWSKPQLVFVNSMSDLWHKEIPFEFIRDVFETMATGAKLVCRKKGCEHEDLDACYRDVAVHQYQVLTKRPERALAFFQWLDSQEALGECLSLNQEVGNWPIRNIWLGVSVEDQRRASRIDSLVRVPAYIKFISFEPLLGPVEADLTGIHWAIIGGESGRGARPLELDWVRSLIEQCRRQGVAVFVKQLGSVWARRNRATNPKGEDPSEWAEDLRIREWPARWER